MILPKPLPSQSELKRRFDYDPKSGELRYREDSLCNNQWNSRNADRVGGSVNEEGYLIIGFNGTTYRAHRLIYKWFYGEEPEIVDHINGNRLDNRIENLRASNKFWNKLNKSQKRPFIVPEPDGKFLVRISYKKEEHYLGRASTYEEAVAWINQFFEEQGIDSRMPVCN